MKRSFRKKRGIWQIAKGLLLALSICITGLVSYSWYASFDRRPASIADFFGRTHLWAGMPKAMFHYWIRETSWNGPSGRQPCSEIYEIQSLRGQLVFSRVWGFYAFGETTLDAQSEPWLRAAGLMPFYGHAPSDPGFFCALPFGVCNIVYRPSPAPPPQSSIFAVSIAHWFAWIISTTPWIALGFLRWRRKSRTRSGECQQCNYNLTGNTSGICPECGTAISTGAIQS
jgi:hypothetical protein